MSSARKYGFDTEFAPDGKILSDPVAARRITPEDVEKQCAQAYERGKKDALAQAERDAAKALQTLADAAQTIVARLNDESTTMRTEATRIASAAARKIAGAALDQFGADHAQAAIEAAMDALRHQPRLLIKVPSSSAEVLRPRLEAMREAHAYGGAILIRDDSALKSGTVIIDWTDGVISLDPADIAARVDALIDATLAGAEA
ncbi:MAG: FliH/SctL family protein [Hyphomonadaceae bacterium]|nr:FliH/SctL family protein [Hyphomonadaceae bacterium]